MIRVLIAGDIRLYREGLGLHLARHDAIDVVASAANSDETCRVAREVAPDVILLDMAMHESLLTVQRLRLAAPDVRVVALAIPDVDHAVIACAEAGVCGFVVRDASFDDLVTAVVSAAHGEASMSPRAAATLLRRVGVLAADRAAPSPHAELTSREKSIVELIADGLSNKEIGARLHVELATVKNHVHNILDKLHVHRRGEIASRLRRRPIDTPTRGELDPTQREMMR